MSTHMYDQPRESLYSMVKGKIKVNGVTLKVQRGFSAWRYVRLLRGVDNFLTEYRRIELILPNGIRGIGDAENKITAVNVAAAMALYQLIVQGKVCPFSFGTNLL